MHPSIIVSAIDYQWTVARDKVSNREAKLEVNLATSQPHEAVGALKLLHYPAQHVQTLLLRLRVQSLPYPDQGPESRRADTKGRVETACVWCCPSMTELMHLFDNTMGMEGDANGRHSIVLKACEAI